MTDTYKNFSKSQIELSEQELAEFLNEIEDEDNAIIEQENNTTKEVTELDIAIGDFTANTTNKADDSTDKAFNEATEAKIKATIEARRKKIVSETAIKRNALNQNIIDLEALIPKKYFRALITILTEPQTAIIAKYKAYINRRLEKILLKLMPRSLRTCWQLYPWAIRKSPGFLYKAPGGKVKELWFWAYPNIPAFFPQYTEREVILQEMPKVIEAVDRAINLYYTHIRDKQKREIRYAEIFIRNNVKTYLDLLKFNPTMWNLLFNYIQNEPKVHNERPAN